MATMVKQMQLADLLDKRQHVADLKKALKQAEDEALKAELIALGALDKGATVERGDYGAAIEETPGQRRPKWKEEFAERCGAIEVQRVIDATPYGAPTRRLVVTERGQVRK